MEYAKKFEDMTTYFEQDMVAPDEGYEIDQERPILEKGLCSR